MQNPNQNLITLDQILQNQKTLPYSTIKTYYLQKTLKMKIYSSSSSIIPESKSYKTLFKIYSKIILKTDNRNFITMFCQIIQKVEKITLSIKCYPNGLRMNFKINERFLKASLCTDVNGAKESKGLFCLRLMVKYFPFFCRMLFFFGKLDNPIFEDLDENDNNFDFSHLENVGDEKESNFGNDINSKSENYGNFGNFENEENFGNESFSDNSINKSLISENDFNNEMEIIDDFRTPEKNNISNFLNKTENFKKKEIPEKIENAEKDNFFFILSNLTNKKISCLKISEKENPENSDYIFSEKIKISDFNFLEKDIKKICSELFLKYQKKKLFHSLIKNSNLIKINFRLKKTKFVFKISLNCLDQNFALNFSSLFLIKKYFPNFYENLFFYFQNLKNNFSNDFIFEEKEENIFWKILEKDNFYKGSICNIQLVGNFAYLKNLILKKENFFQNSKNEKNNFFFGNEKNFNLLSIFFENIGYKYKITIDFDEIFNFVFSFIKLEEEIFLKIGVDSDNFLEAIKLSETKLVEILFPLSIFQNFTNNYLSSPKKITQKDIFKKFNCKILEKKFPNQNFIFSENKKKIEDLDFDPKEDDLQEIIPEIGSLYNLYLNLEVEEIDNYKEIFFILDDNKENSYYFKVECEEVDEAMDFCILKFLEREWKEAFDWAVVNMDEEEDDD